jgi:hypothetical protein
MFLVGAAGAATVAVGSGVGVGAAWHAARMEISTSKHTLTSLVFEFITPPDRSLVFIRRQNYNPLNPVNQMRVY